MEIRERCYLISSCGVALDGTLAALRREVEVFLNFNDSNVQVEIDGGDKASAGDTEQMMKLRVRSTIISDEIIDSAVRLGASQLKVTATRIREV